MAGTSGSAVDLFGFESLHGHYEAKIDSNGRIVLPAALKYPFVDSAVVGLRDNGRFIFLSTRRVFDLSVQAMLDRNPEGVLSPATKARFYKSTLAVSVDSQHRFVVPPKFREIVGLESRIYLTGARSMVEIWPADRFEAEEIQTLDEPDLLWRGFEGL